MEEHLKRSNQEKEAIRKQRMEYNMRLEEVRD
jgi:hypothetical protein